MNYIRLPQLTTLGLFIALGCLPLHSLSQNFTKLPSQNINQTQLDTRSVMVVDVDNNSQPDLHFGNINGGHEYYLNYDTTFQTPASNGLIPLSFATSGVSSGDLNRDGWLDLFFANGSGGQTAVNQANSLFINDSLGIYSSQYNTATSAARTSGACRFVDFDKDGDLDIYVSNTGYSRSEFYRNDGNNIFVSLDTLPMTTTYYRSGQASWCDYDNDGDIDLFLPITDGGNNRLYRNDDTTFTEITTGNPVSDGGNSFSGVWGDYNNDGWLDLFVGNTNTSLNFLYKNLGNGNFQKITTGPIVSETGKTVSALWLDVDNDGDLDLFTASGNGTNSYVRRNRLYINNGNETFTKVLSGILVTDQSNSTGAACGDLDRDGDIDIALSTRNGKNDIFFNEYSGNNSFISLNILGTHNKASALDAKVRIKCPVNGVQSTWQFRQIKTDQGNAGESSNIIHFGTGSATLIDSLVVQWISGKTCIFTNLDVNEFYNISPDNCNLDLALDTRHSTEIQNLHVNFHDSTVGSVIKHEWRFGDGNISNAPNPTHTYATPGTYTVEHLTFDSYQKWDSAWSMLTICPDTARLGFVAAGTGQQITFTDTSISNAYLFQWDFGDGDTAYGSIVSHNYSLGGVYTTCLYVTDSCRMDTICQNITVCNDTLQAHFSHNVSTYSVTLNDSSINANKIIWDFGDGNLDSINASPLHIYSAPGNYEVCMIVVDDCTADTLCKTISICPDTVKSDFIFQDSLKTVNFSSQAIHASSYLWTFGDGNSSTASNPAHTYQQAGSYNVCLIANNDCNTDTLCKTVVVCSDSTHASFTYADSNKTVTFTSSSINANTYLWDFGDGSLSTLQNPTYTYQSLGTYTICLITSNDCGSDTSCTTINLCPKVVQSAFTNQHLIGLNMQFFEACRDAISFYWDFGDSTYSTVPNPTHNYSSAWVYNVCLTATDSCGKAATQCKVIDLTAFSFKDYNLLKALNIYPNPTKDYIFLKTPQDFNGQVQMTIYDLQGKLLIKEEWNESRSSIDISSLTSGIYHLHIKLMGMEKVFKVIKKN